jgi:hypothetical protein
VTSLRWVADGIEVAERAGGITLDKSRRAGFTGGGMAVRKRPEVDHAISGFPIEVDPDPPEDDE